MWNLFHSILHIKDVSKQPNIECQKRLSLAEVPAYARVPRLLGLCAGASHEARRPCYTSFFYGSQFPDSLRSPETESRWQELALQTGPAPNDLIEDKLTQRNPWNT